MIKGSIREEDITIVNIYALNIGAPQCIRQTLTEIKGEIDSNTIICRVHHEKHWAGGSTSWNQDCQKKYQ